MREEHFNAAKTVFKKMAAKQMNKWDDSLLTVNVQDLFVDVVREAETPHRFWICDQQYFVFTGFTSRENANECLEWLKNTEVLFL